MPTAVSDADDGHPRTPCPARAVPPDKPMTIVIATDWMRLTTTAAAIAAHHTPAPLDRVPNRSRGRNTAIRATVSSMPEREVEEAPSTAVAGARSTSATIMPHHAGEDHLSGRAEEQPDHQRQLVHRERVRVVADLDVHGEAVGEREPDRQQRPRDVRRADHRVVATTPTTASTTASPAKAKLNSTIFRVASSRGPRSEPGVGHDMVTTPLPARGSGLGSQSAGIADPPEG